jgi:hypothetical protein
MMGRAMSLNGYNWVEGNLANRVDRSGLWGELPGKYDTCASDKIIPPSIVRKPIYPPTPTPHPTCSGIELDECDIRYLAHISAAEASGTNSNTVMAAIMLAQINAYNAGGFAPFRVAEQFLEANQRAELINLYYQGQTPPESNEALITQSQAYTAYRAICQAGNLTTPNFAGYSTALQMAQKMGCTSDPLANFNAGNFGITNTADLQAVAGAPHLRQENSFCSSVLNKVPEWQARATELGRSQSPYVPAWYPEDENHIIFDGSPRSVVIYSSGGSPIHRNWQCPQFPGQPTVHLRADGQCVQCSGQEVFDAGIYQRCEGGTEQVLGSPITACT